jgi:ribonucleoside-diphosphate reductase alpha chain
MALAQEVLIELALDGDGYPDPRIAETTRRFRDIGVGYANLGALLISMGIPYDSPKGREMAGAVASVMTASAYRTSALVAARVGPFEAYPENRAGTLGVLRMHQEANRRLATAHLAAGIWDEVLELAETHGVRNAEATVLAPTGTISFLMGCETTGIEPAFSLVAFKQLVGGGTMRLTVGSVEAGLDSLGYRRQEVDRIVAWVAEHGTAVGAPGLRSGHEAVFATAVGEGAIEPMGHVRMMAAVQPFISGAISKTVNMPEDTTVEDVEQLYLDAWKMGIKAIAIYRDGCKAAQPLSAKPSGQAQKTPASATDADSRPHPVRERLPRTRTARTFAFRVGDCEGYFTVGEYPDGRPGELFMKVSKQGSTLSGVMDAFAIAVSLGLQYGVPLETFVSKYANMRFEPAGITDSAEVGIATSLVDFVFKTLAVQYLDPELRQQYGILTKAERSVALGAHVADPVPVAVSNGNGKSHYGDAPLCPLCGVAMDTRTGSCWAHSACGSTAGCS